MLILELVEILRKYPPGVRIERRCTQDYTIPGTNSVIGKDSIVVIPAVAIHRDSDHYPDPEKFDPERFTSEAKTSRHPYTYMPFGQGPRNCKSSCILYSRNLGFDSEFNYYDFDLKQ